jgi:hypothetical protein
VELVGRRDWQQLLQYDELTRELRAGRVLCGFTALTPAFAPTFKRVRDASLAHTDLTGLASESSDGEAGASYYSPKRMPSYTDRVLYKSLPGFAPRLQELAFESLECVSSSDHKPVRASFRLGVLPGAEGVDVRASGRDSFELCVSQLRVSPIESNFLAVLSSFV